MENKAENLSAEASVPSVSKSSLPPRQKLNKIQRLEVMLESGENCLIKGLTAAQQRALFSSVTKYMIKSSQDLAKQDFGQRLTKRREKKNWQQKLLKLKSPYRKKLELLYFFQMPRIVYRKYLIELLDQCYCDQEKKLLFLW